MAPAAVARAAAPRGDLAVVLGALTGGLLSSSCCIIQLALNSLSVGCAGLSAFKPFRPALRLLTACLLGLLLARQGVSKRTLGTALASLLLTFSEDAVAALNRHGSAALALRRAGLLRGGSADAGGGADGDGGGGPALVKWAVEVEGMRCQACAARVRGSVAGLPGVVNATVALAEGRVEVWAAPGGGGDDGRALAAAIGAIDDGYAVRVVGRECFDSGERPVACGGGGGAARQSEASGGGAARPRGQAPPGAAGGGKQDEL